MAFKTKLDFSSNRQVKQHEKTITALSGGTSFGLPYSAMTSGPDLSTSAVTQTIVSITGYTSTFSGNNTTTQYNWFDTRMTLGESMLSAITSTTSAATQVVGGVYTANTNTTIDGNLVNLTYTGVSYNVNPLTVIDLGGGNYTGTVRTYQLDILSASTLDYTGRTIWNDVSGITRTQRLIISDMPVSGYVWTCIDSEGMGEWQYNGSSSGSTIWTAGTGTNSAVLGSSNSVGVGNYSVSEGYRGISSGDYTHSEGYMTSATTVHSHSEGRYTIASGQSSHAEGELTIAGSDFSHAEGNTTQAMGSASHAEGASTIASGDNSHAEGVYSQAIGSWSHAEGATTVATGDAAHAEGWFTNADGPYSHAEGRNTIAGTYSHAEGSFTVATGFTSHAEGDTTVASGYYSHAGGYKSTADGEAAFVHSYSSSTLNSNQSAILGGKNAYIVDSDYSGILSGLWNQIGLTEAGFNSSAYYGVVLGGNNNTIYEATISSSILGGQYNNIHKFSNYSSLVGGQYNEITGSSINSGIFVGTGNTITNTSKNAAIIAGQNNTISGHSNSVIVGGNSNFIDFCLNNYGTSANETIVGGAGNQMYTADNSFIAGGLYNLIDGRTASIGSNGSFVIGSFMSSAFTSNNSGILGGWKNAILSSECSYITNTLILGGEENTYNPQTGPGNGAGGNNILLGGANNQLIGSNIYKSAIIGGNNNGILANTVNSVVIGGTAITATTDDTVYVPNMIINTGGTRSMLGINTSTPEYIIDANGNNARLILADTYTGADAPAKSFVFSADSTNLSQIAALTNNYYGGYGLSLQMGVLGNNITSTSTTVLLGTSGDTFISSSQQTNNLNIINRDGGSGTNHIRMYAGVNSVSAASVPDFQIQGTGTTRGYIGIKTNSPEYLLDIIGSTTSRVFYDPTSANGQFAISAKTGLPRFAVATNSGVVNQNGGISMGMRGWDDPTYDTYGKPGDSHIYSSKQANGLVIISSDGTGTEDYIECWVGGDPTSGELAIHMHGTGSTKGYVGFNTNLPTQQIDVNGNARFRSIGSAASSGALHYAADGTLTMTVSDERLKTNITTLTGALDKVNQLRGVTYNWTENPTGDTRIGFIAQEVNAIVPELTFTNPNSPENYMGVHYDNVTALLVEAVKELSSGVTTSNNIHLETQTILAEDNNIELNYSGTPETAIGGGIRILHALGTDNAAELITDIDGNFVTNNDLKPQALTIPLYTPTSSNDTTGSEGNITRDDNYMYVKTSTGWKRTNLESF